MSQDGEVLDPEEIDALLKSANGGEAPAPSGDARAFDPANPGLYVRGRLPALTSINERLARQLRIGLHTLIRTAVDVTVGPVRVLKFGEYLEGLPVPTSLNSVRLPPLRGNAIFIFDSSLIYRAVDRFFGGNGRPVKVEGRDFTRTEARMIQLLMKQFSTDFRDAWAPVAPFQVEVAGSEFNPQFVNMLAPSEVVVISSFEVHIDGSSGQINVAMPYAMVEPLREGLESPTQPAAVARDSHWARTLHEEIEAAEVEIVPVIGQSEITVARLLALKPGDVIPCDFSGSVTLMAEGIPILRGSYGASRGQQSVKVEQHLAHPRQAHSFQR